MNATDTLDTRHTDGKTINALMAAVEQYEPTPQEIRYGQIEYHARELIHVIRKGGVLGMTGEAKDKLAQLAQVIGCRCERPGDVPLVK